MSKRPDLKCTLDSKVFGEYYYLKEELVLFCKENQLPTSGSKLEIANRIKIFLDNGDQQQVKKVIKSSVSIEPFTLSTIIEPNIRYSEKHRTFFKQYLGKSFSFNVPFQRWLKENSGKTYKDAIDIYPILLKEKKEKGTQIDAQFEYNTYIHAFFLDNQDKSLKDAIKCWKYKKSLRGHNKYEKSDCIVLR
ncbi:MAG: DUF6434 domain-containing protein [Anaerorhabdus sp.]|jgi:hypothetical protein|uniref:DUF6434 domain-containing protein n=1 Tax=Anaerorhabdus sp. TaxID=1872524 RepID=UPI002FCB25C4